jgi:hypothetical protein
LWPKHEIMNVQVPSMFRWLYISDVRLVLVVKSWIYWRCTPGNLESFSM